MTKLQEAAWNASLFLPFSWEMKELLHLFSAMVLVYRHRRIVSTREICPQEQPGQKKGTGMNKG
jgi:hypothetical protein